MCPIHYSAEASLSEGESGCKETSNSRLYMLVDRCPIIYNPAQMHRCTLWLPAIIQGHQRNLVLILGLPGLWSVKGPMTSPGKAWSQTSRFCPDGTCPNLSGWCQAYPIFWKFCPVFRPNFVRIPQIWLPRARKTVTEYNRSYLQDIQ